MNDCIFCRILRREIPTDFIYEDDRVVVISDIHPKAPIHMLVLTREHRASLLEMAPSDESLLGHALMVGRDVAEQKGLEAFRVVINTGVEAGQSVFHFHLHILGGEKFTE